GGDDVGLPVTVQIGQREGVHGRLSSKHPRVAEIAVPVSQKHGDEVAGLIAVDPCIQERHGGGDYIELPVAVQICKCKSSSNVTDTQFPDATLVLECPVAIALEERGDSVIICVDQVCAAVSSHITESNVRNKRSIEEW